MPGKPSREASCVLCRRRKVRCDKQNPCSNCVKAQVKCHFAASRPPRPRTKGNVDRDLILRIQQYEKLFAENGIDIETVREDLRIDHIRQTVEDDELEKDFDRLTNESSEQLSHSGYEPSNTASYLQREFSTHEELLHNSSDEDDTEPPTLHRAFNRMFTSNHFSIVLGTDPVPVSYMHPSPVHVLQLWQIYIDNVNCLLRLHHVPSLQTEILKAASNIENLSLDLEPVMFGIYLMAINSMQDEDVHTMLGAPKQQLLLGYHAALQQALTNAGFLRQPSLYTLQAFVLDLLAIKPQMDPRQIFALFGMAVRLAQQMGLHKHNTGSNLFETEQRRRLWWVIVCYDRRLGEMTGSANTAASSATLCPTPLNLDDCKLHIVGEESPKQQDHPTEMTFALSRIELARVYMIGSNDHSANATVSSKPDTSVASQARVRLTGTNTEQYTLDEFEAHIKTKFLFNCDLKVPLYEFTDNMVRQSLSKMRTTNYLMHFKKLSISERHDLFRSAVELVALDNAVQSSDNLRRFRWYSVDHLPVAASMFLARELRKRITGEEVDRAWESLSQNYELRQMRKRRNSPMHLAFANHLLKAWTGYEAAQRSSGKLVARLPIIQQMLEDKMKEENGSWLDQSENMASIDFATAPRIYSESNNPGGLHNSATREQTTGQNLQSEHYFETFQDEDMDWMSMMPEQHTLFNVPDSNQEFDLLNAVDSTAPHP